jgi:hypothetical protein
LFCGLAGLPLLRCRERLNGNWPEKLTEGFKLQDFDFGASRKGLKRRSGKKQRRAGHRSLFFAGIGYEATGSGRW